MFLPTLPHWIVFLLCFSSIHKDEEGKGCQCAKHPRGPGYLKDMLSDVTSSFCQRGLHILGARAPALSLPYGLEVARNFTPS